MLMRCPNPARVRRLHAQDDGQVAWLFLLSTLALFGFFAFAADAGIWYFDHRLAQNQAEAAAQAAAVDLPAASTATAEQAAKDALARNGVNWASEGCSPNWIEFSDAGGTGEYNRVKVCLRRTSSVVFSALSNISAVFVSASSTVVAGRVDGSNVMPFAIIPPDPNCTLGQTCRYDANADGDYTDPGECLATFATCPWGLNKDSLYRFKSGGGGNTGVIDACGGGSSSYKDCITGAASSGFYSSGQTIVVGLQGGNLGSNTDTALNQRFATETADGTYDCDVLATPDPVSGYDPDGHAIAYQRFSTNPPAVYCRQRLVLIPILRSMPPSGGGSSSIQVLGVATFGIAAWNHVSNKDAHGTTTAACSTSVSSGFECGMVWGYLMEGLRPPDFLLQKITNSNNPFAPILVAVVE